MTVENKQTWFLFRTNNNCKASKLKFLLFIERHLWILNFNFPLFVSASSEYFKYLANSLLLTTAEQSLAPSCEWHKIFQVPGHKTFRNTNLQPLSLDRWRRIAVLWKTTRRYNMTELNNLQSRQKKLILSKLNDGKLCNSPGLWCVGWLTLSHPSQSNCHTGLSPTLSFKCIYLCNSVREKLSIWEYSLWFSIKII